MRAHWAAWEASVGVTAAVLLFLKQSITNAATAMIVARKACIEIVLLISLLIRGYLPLAFTLVYYPGGRIHSMDCSEGRT